MELGQPDLQEEPDRRVCVACPACNQGYRVATRLLGRRLVCRHCRHEWRCAEVDPSAIRRPPSEAKSEPPSDSTQAFLPEDSPPLAGSSSTTIDTRWAGRKLGRYKVLSILGQGGMGVVWRGHDETLRRDVALKILNRRRKTTGESCLNTELFMQEARAVAKLQHPHVVSIYEVAEDESQVFLALELMEGGTLKEYVDRNGPIAPRELFAMMVGPTRALALAHKRGIIHRDIKPGNLMFDDHGHLKLMDFGLAEVAQEAASQRMKGKAVGSLGWVAPETVRGQGTTPSSDIYSMGLVMLFALIGKSWLHADSKQKLIALHQNPPPLDLTGIKGLTQRGAQLLRKALTIDQAQRFVSAEAFSEEIQRAADEDPGAVSERRKSHASIAAVAAAIGLLVGVGGVAWYFLRLAEKTSELSMPVVQYKPKTPSGANSAKQDGAKPAPAALKFESAEEARVPWPEVPYLVNPAELAYITDNKDKLFHLPTCPKARQILASELSNFESIDLAQSAGLKPCPLCQSQPGPKPNKNMGPVRPGG